MYIWGEREMSMRQVLYECMYVKSKTWVKIRLMGDGRKIQPTKHMNVAFKRKICLFVSMAICN